MALNEGTVIVHWYLFSEFGFHSANDIKNLWKPRLAEQSYNFREQQILWKTVHVFSIPEKYVVFSDLCVFYRLFEKAL